MAEDALVGFKFKDLDNDIAMDADVRLATETMFSEMSFDQLGAGAEMDKVSPRDAEVPSEFESFDFTEGFDFTF